MELNIQNREHGRRILELVEHGPLIWPTVEENRVFRTKKYDKLFAAEKTQVDRDMKATNIILQSLPVDIYSLVNHHRPKQPRNVAWYKEKTMLAEAQEAGQMLDGEQLAFLVDLGIPSSQAQKIIPHNAAFQTKNLDTYDSDCDDLSTA
nr:hypothetical protein [Tanacetum cinerariifolium]